MDQVTPPCHLESSIWSVCCREDCLFCVSVAAAVTRKDGEGGLLTSLCLIIGFPVESRTYNSTAPLT